MIPTPLPTYIFPAASSSSSSVNDTTLLQYLASSGSLTDESGNPFVDVAALTEVLTFYEQARDNAILNTSVLQYASTADTWNAYIQGAGDLAEVNSRVYLAGRFETRNTSPTFMVTALGKPVTLVDGWLWVLLTSDPQRQASALALIDWLMEPANHGRFSQAAGYLPSQPSALSVWGDDDPYVPFVNTLMQNATILPDPEIEDAIGVALQDALEDVLLSGSSAVEAANAAAAAVNTGVEN